VRTLAEPSGSDVLDLPPEWRVEDLGEVQLRGKMGPLRLVALA
jgi:hypothetical protein